MGDTLISVAVGARQRGKVRVVQGVVTLGINFHRVRQTLG